MDLYLYLILGMLVYCLIDFSSFNRSLPSLSKKSALKNYLNLNSLMLIAGFLFGYAVISTLDSGINKTILNFFGVSELGIKQNTQSAFLIGLFSQWLLIKIRKLNKPGIFLTKHNKIETIKDIN